MKNSAAIIVFSCAAHHLLPALANLRPNTYVIFVSVHRVPHLLCCRAVEVQKVRLHARRRASTAPCERLQGSAL